MFTRTKQALCAIPLCFALLLSGALPMAGGVRAAHADELSDAKATLDAASKELDALTSEYRSLETELASLDEQISEATDKVAKAQQAMIEGQEDLGDTVVAQYKSDGSLSFTAICLNSADLSDLVKNMFYYGAIQQDQADRIAEQKKLRDDFQSALSDLDAKRDSQQDLLDQAEAKKERAEKVVSEASSKVASIESERKRLADLKKKAASLEKKQQDKQSSQSSSPNWNTGSDRPSQGEDHTQEDTSTNAPSSSKGWKTGVASAYGGKTDPWTPNPGTTATGAVCNDSSMGVAIPTAWANYSSYFGRAVEIRYGGKTVVATINDCGGMGGGSRSLDLQPGVWKAFGFSSCQDWGLRTVSYRIL